MIQISADTRRAVVTNKELLTVGSAGIQVEFTLSEDWDGLAKLAVFRVGDEGTKVDVALGIDLTCVVPPEVLLDEGEPLFIGIYGANESGSVIIPTIWASAGVVKPGTEPNTPATAEPTPVIWAQILSVAEDAEQTAAAAMSNVEVGLQELSGLENTVQNAEDQRQANELVRIANETERVAAETERSSAENSREVSETTRLGNETTRQNNETARVAAETARASAETSRASAEEERAAAEAIREANYATYVETVSGYADAASTSAYNASVSASAASTYAGQASASASSAAGNASAASSSATSAAGYATTAGTHAGTATTKAQEAAASAAAASDSATMATSAKNAAVTAQGAAEAAQAAAEEAQEAIEDAAAQIEQNTQDIADLEDEKQDKPATAGTAGQVLGLDANLDPVWVDQTSGGVTSVNGKTGAVTLDAGDIEFDDSVTYAAGSIGAEVSDAKNAIDQKQAAPSSAGTAGQVLGLDSNLDPVWVNQSGGGDTSNCAPIIINTASGGITSFADGADNRQIRKLVGTIVTAEGGSGRTGATVRIAKKNLFDKSKMVTLTGVYQRFMQYGVAVHGDNTPTGLLRLDPGNYVFSLSGDNSTVAETLSVYDQSLTRLAVAYQNKVLAFTVPQLSNYFISCTISTENFVSWDNYNIQLEKCSTPTEYEPFQGQTIPINWQSSAGTILNGTVTLSEDGSADVVNSDSGNSYHLTDVGSLYTYLGANNVWIDTGAITECDYPADTKLYIDGLTAPDEDMIANANIASGKYFVVNNQLYLSTAAIAAGASIVPGTNCTATNLAEALNALNT